MSKYVFINKGIQYKTKDLTKATLQGFKVRPKNKIKNDMIRVTRATIINSEFIEAILTKKTDSNFKKYLKYVISIIEEEPNEDNNNEVRIALDEVARLKSIIKNKYKKYLKDEEIEKNLNRLTFLEKELIKKSLLFRKKKKRKTR
jgi:hypothetical protein